MCGIMGYIGPKQAVSIIVEGLRRLEYRGYDSAGVAVIEDGTINIRRSVGKLTNLDEKLRVDPPKGTLGIGHTRWATHGKPSETNAHPHVDCKGDLAVVHNGIIENYMELRKKLEAEGHRFDSQTDTEVVAHLVEKYLSSSLEEALRKALVEVRGSYALVLISRKDPGKLVISRKGSAGGVVVGYGVGEMFVASDMPALLDHTRRLSSLDEGELAVVTADDFRCFNSKGSRVDKAIRTVAWDPVRAAKEGYPHFMLKEIHEQPRSVADTIRSRMDYASADVYLADANLTPEDIKRIDRITIVACGTAWHAGLVGKFSLERLARIPVEVDYASEYRYRSPLINERTLVLSITQSGETADTLAAMDQAKAEGARVLTICNVVDSMATRKADGVIYTHAGPEISVASTKAFTSQLTALYLLSIYLGRRRGTLSEERASDLIGDLAGLPGLVNQVLSSGSDYEDFARKYSAYDDFLYLGRGINYPIALEGALKLKELSYIHAEGYPSGEMKHGPIALIDKDVPTVAIAVKDNVYEKMLSNIEEVRARDGLVVAVASRGDKDIEKKSDALFAVPTTVDLFLPVLTVVPLQLIAYYISKVKGYDVDQPRNLAKSVTVE
jgi:glucosamine--fructose-6-phosphate aminotransferase (isomerizing)